MKKSDVIKQLILNGNIPQVTHRFPINQLPDTIKVSGIEKSGVTHRVITKEMFEQKLKNQKEDEVLTMGRDHPADVKFASFSDTRWSRIQLIWKKEGDEAILIDCSRNGGTHVFKGDELIPPTENYPWEEWLSTIQTVVKDEPEDEQSKIRAAIKNLLHRN